jgi:hypothetical protein
MRLARKFESKTITPTRLRIFGFAAGNDKLNIPSDFDFLKVTAVGKNARRPPHRPHGNIQSGGELFGGHPGASFDQFAEGVLRLPGACSS